LCEDAIEKKEKEMGKGGSRDKRVQQREEKEGKSLVSAGLMMKGRGKW